MPNTVETGEKESQITDVISNTKLNMIKITPFLKANMLQTVLCAFDNCQGTVVLTSNDDRAQSIENSNYVVTQDYTVIGIMSIHNDLSVTQQDWILEKFNNNEIEVISLSYDLLMSFIKDKKEMEIKNIIVYDLPEDLLEHRIFNYSFGLKKKRIITVLFDKKSKQDLKNVEYLLYFLEQNGQEIPAVLLKAFSELLNKTED